MMFASRNSRVGFAVSIPPSGTSRREAGGGRRGLVEEEAEPFSEAGSAMGSEKLQNSLEKVMAIRVGHVWGFLVGWVWLHPKTRPHWPSLCHHSRRTPLRGRFARLARLPHSAAPGGECGARTKHFYRTRFTPPRRLPGRFLLHCLRPPVAEKRAGRPRSGIRSPAH